MPYHIYVPWITKLLQGRPQPNVLEIGVDAGQTLMPLCHNLCMISESFNYTGLDVRRDDNVMAMLRPFMVRENQHIDYVVDNSLEWLPECSDKFDLILIDGDHNYHTVSQELSHLNRLLKPDGVCICDDYSGKWAERDLFYSTRETHDGVENTTEKVDTERHGVKTAIDDWVKENKDWKLTSAMHSESIILLRRETAMKLGI